MEVGQQVRQAERRAGRDHPDRDAPAQQPRELVHDEPRAGDGGERGTRVREDGGTGPGRAHRAPRAVQQALAQLSFELSDLRAHPWLRHVQLGRGLGEARLLDDGHEVLQLPQLHKH